MLIFNKKINKIFSVFFILLFLSFLSFGFFSISFAQNPLLNPTEIGQSPNTNFYPTPTGQAPVNTLPANNSTTTTDTDTTYTPLAPLPGLEGAYQTAGDCPLGKYLKIMFGLFLGIAAVLAMVMIVMGGMEYMTSELISSKESGKDKIKNAIFGLLLALSAYLILNTINPNLLDICLDGIPKAQITIGPDAGDDTVDPGYASGARVYSTNATVTPSVVAATAKLASGWEITKINVYTNNTMQIDMQKGSQFDNSTYLSIAPGLNGYAPVGTAHGGDKKTPLGTWRILSVNYTPGVAQFSGTGSNMGAAFWLLSPMNSGERGIGIHGNKTGTLSNTNGCIRLKNADILALQPFIRTGIQVVIQ